MLENGATERMVANLQCSKNIIDRPIIVHKRKYLVYYDFESYNTTSILYGYVFTTVI